MAGDCLLAQPSGSPLTRNLPLKLDESAAIYDPLQSLKIRDILAL
jgi:hypothetical protein